MRRSAWSWIAGTAWAAVVLAGAAPVGGPAVAQGAPSAPRAATLTLDHIEVNNDEATTSLGKPGWSKLGKGSTSATFEYAEKRVKGVYNWTVPKTIPAGGADLKLRATASDGTGYRMNAYIGVDGTYGALKGGTSRIEILAAADKNAGKPTAVVAKTFRILPTTAPANALVYLRVDLGPEGPSITYFYRVGAEPLRVDVRFHAFSLQTTPPFDAGDCPTATRAIVTGFIVARITEQTGHHEGSGHVTDTPHRSQCRVPRIGLRVDHVDLHVIKPSHILRVRLSVHITSEGVHRPGDCRVGTLGTITATFDDTKKGLNGLTTHSLSIGPWRSPCTAHTHVITNTVSSIPARAAGSTWVTVWIACKEEGSGFGPRNCGA